MSESNRTHADRIHRVYISAPKLTGDRTGLYIVFLLCMLLFILLFYLVYNFISYKRYCSTRRKKNFYSHREDILSIERKLKEGSLLHKEFTVRSQQLSPPTSKPLSINPNSKPVKTLSPSKDQHSIKTYLISDL